MKIKKILVSQPKPTSDKSPYHTLAEKNNLTIDFRQFIKIEGIDLKDFRKQKIDTLAFTAVIFTSKNAIDHYFRICEELRVPIAETMKYFCTTEAVAFYLQKYIVYRKRKIFYGDNQVQDLVDLIKKHNCEKYLLPVSDIHTDEFPELLEKQKIEFTKAVFYKTVSSDLTDVSQTDYDMFVFFSPSGIKSLFENFPNFKQDHIKIASFGPNTAKAAIEAGLTLDVIAPTPEFPSMTMALEKYIEKHNKLVKA